MADLQTYLDNMTPERRLYTIQSLPTHLATSNRQNKLRQLLLDFNWMQAKLDDTNVNALIADYDFLLSDKDMSLISESLKLSGDDLNRYKRQLPNQLYARLLLADSSILKALLSQIHRCAVPWLKPLVPSLSTAGGPLLRTFRGHSDMVLCVGVGAGEIAVSGSKDQTLKVWDLTSGQLLFTFEACSGAVHAVCILADGSRAVSISEYSILSLWDLEQGRELCSYRGDDWLQLQGLAVMPNQRRIVFGCWDRSYCGTLRMWDIEAWRELDVLSGHLRNVTSVAVSPDSARVISGSEDHTVRDWDLESSKEIRILGAHNSSVSALAVAPDGNRAVSVSLDGTMKIWDLVRKSAETLVHVLDRKGETQLLRGGREECNINAHKDLVTSVAIIRGGSRAVSASRDHTLRVWDLGSGKLLGSLCGHASDVNTVAALPDGRRVVSASSDNTLRLWDSDRTHETKHIESHVGKVGSIVVSASGRAVSASNDLKLWRIADGKHLCTLPASGEIVLAVAVSPDGRMAASISGGLTLWNLENGSKIRMLQDHIDSWLSIATVAFTPDGKHVISPGATGSWLNIIDVKTGREVGRLIGHSGGIRSFIISQDGHLLISASEDRTLNIWDINGEKLLRTLTGHEDWVSGVAILDEVHVISASYDGTLRVWQTHGAWDTRVLKSSSGPVLNVSIVPGVGHVVSSHCDGTLRIWDPETSRTLCVLADHVVPVAPRDNWFSATHVYGRGASVWNIEHIKKRNVSVAHDKHIVALEVLPDGNHVISASRDRSIKVWDLKSRCIIATFLFDSEPSCCAISPDGQTIVVGDDAGRVHFLHLEGV